MDSLDCSPLPSTCTSSTELDRSKDSAQETLISMKLESSVTVMVLTSITAYCWTFVASDTATLTQEVVYCVYILLLFPLHTILTLLTLLTLLTILILSTILILLTILNIFVDLIV